MAEGPGISFTKPADSGPAAGRFAGVAGVILAPFRGVARRGRRGVCGQGCGMLALMGLIGLVAAGVAADAVLNSSDPEDDPADEDGVETAEQGVAASSVDADGARLEAAEMAAAGAALAESLAEEGVALSDDLPDEPDPATRQTGTAAGDILNGGGGDDTLIGGDGQDALAGSGGNDVLWGGDGADVLDGAAGDDLLQGRADHDTITAGAGADTLRGGAGADQLAGQSGDDLMAGGLGEDSLLGGEGNDTARGGAGADWLEGGWGDDALSGGTGDDTVDGGAGNDTLNAGTGADFLNGGAGNDLLRLTGGTFATGGEGADRFELMPMEAGAGMATVADYDPGTDRLVVMLEPAAGGAVPEVAVRESGEDALILVDGTVVARVIGAAGLTADQLILQPA
ncbi:MAG: calcium-binding protein [Rhodobacteraceae bacterium]|nr:calcium-binding protein [Paracoccaceae bacterium]